MALRCAGVFCRTASCPTRSTDVGHRPRKPGGHHHRHRAEFSRAGGRTPAPHLPSRRPDRAYRPHPLEGRHLLMKSPRNRGAGDQRDQTAGLAPFEIPLLCDIVLAADTAQFQDSAHFPPTWCRATACTSSTRCSWHERGRYFLLTGRRSTPRRRSNWASWPRVLPARQAPRAGVGTGGGALPAGRPCCCAILASC